MRLVPLTLLIVLATLTELAWRPILALGTVTPDVPLLLVIWLAHFDRRPRVHVAAALEQALQDGGARLQRDRAGGVRRQRHVDQVEGLHRLVTQVAFNV